MTKKILPIIVLGGLLAALLLPVVSLAQQQIPDRCMMRVDLTNLRDVDCPSRNVGCRLNSPIHDCGICCMLNTVHTATNWFFYVLIILSTILIIWGAFAILFATGDPEKMKKGRSIIIYAIVGIAVALFARVIPAIVRFMMGV